MSKRKTFWMVLAMVLALATAPAFAQGKGKSGGSSSGKSAGKGGNVTLTAGRQANSKGKSSQHISNNESGPDQRPAGWDQGKKEGWGDCNVPPGLAKKRGCDASGLSTRERAAKAKRKDKSNDKDKVKAASKSDDKKKSSSTTVTTTAKKQTTTTASTVKTTTTTRQGGGTRGTSRDAVMVERK